MKAAPLTGRGSKRRNAALVLSMSVSMALGCASASENPSAGPAGECATCHLHEYRATRHPLHVGTKPTTCGICHGTEAWHPSTVQHPWPLTGAHATATCFYCHEGSPPVFRGTAKECVGCHRKDYDTSPFPGHSRFPTTCADCHSTAAWKPAARPPPETASAPAQPIQKPAELDTARRSQSPRSRVPSPATTAPRPTPTSYPAKLPDSVTGASRRSHGR